MHFNSYENSLKSSAVNNGMCVHFSTSLTLLQNNHFHTLNKYS